MTDFADIVQGAAWASLAAVHGMTVTYNPAGGDPVDITAIWTVNEMLPGYYPDAEQAVSAGVLRASAADVTSPSDRDTFTISGTTWAVQSVGRSSPIVDFQLVARALRRVGGANTRTQR